MSTKTLTRTPRTLRVWQRDDLGAWTYPGVTADYVANREGETWAVARLNATTEAARYYVGNYPTIHEAKAAAQNDDAATADRHRKVI